MPRYEFTCDTPECDGAKTLICSVKEKPDLVQCPKCGVRMEQTFSKPAMAFKGAGWTPKHYPHTDH